MTPPAQCAACAPKPAIPSAQIFMKALGVDKPITTGAVCVYHSMVETAVEALQGSGIPVAAVSTGFPAGLISFDQKIAEIKAPSKQALLKLILSSHASTC